MPNPHVLTNPDHFVTQPHSTVEQDIKTSSLSLACLASTGHAAIAMGSWEVDSPFTDPMSLGTTTTLINTDGAWKLAVVGIGPQLSAQER